MDIISFPPKTINMSNRSFLFILLLVTSFFVTNAQNYLGIWKNSNSEFELKKDGTTVLGRFPAQYSYQNGFMTFDFGAGIKMKYKVTVAGNTMTSTGYGKTEVYQRVTTKNTASSGSSGKSSKSGGKEIAGEWCKFSNSTNYSYSSQTCITLYANGTYTYSGNSSTSGSYGSTAGQSGDSGTWSYDGKVLHINSRSSGSIQYSCTKTYSGRDVALNIDGTVFVTTQNRGGW